MFFPAFPFPFFPFPSPFLSELEEVLPELTEGGSYDWHHSCQSGPTITSSGGDEHRSLLASCCCCISCCLSCSSCFFGPGCGWRPAATITCCGSRGSRRLHTKTATTNKEEGRKDILRLGLLKKGCHSITLLTSPGTSLKLACPYLMEEAFIGDLPFFMHGSLRVPAKRHLRMRDCLPFRLIPPLL